MGESQQRISGAFDYTPPSIFDVGSPQSIHLKERALQRKHKISFYLLIDKTLLFHKFDNLLKIRFFRTHFSLNYSQFCICLALRW